MLKALVLFALWVCTLGFGVFTPRMDPAFHATFDENGYTWDEYIVHFGGTVYYGRGRYDNGESYLCRCDIQSGPATCFVKYDDDTSSSGPKCQFENPWDYNDLYYDPFYYESATAAACPDGVSDGCMNYTSKKGVTLTADSKNRVVMYTENSIVIQTTYHDDVPTVDTFADTDCEGEALQAPTPFGAVSLKGIGCAFSFTLEGVFGAQDVRGFKEGDDVKFIMINASGYQLVVRCDVEKCYTDQYSDEGCGTFIAPSAFYVLNDILPQGEFGYLGEAESVSCSEDGSAECLKYTSPYQEGYIIVDSENRIVVRGVPDDVQTPYIVTAVKYKDEEPNIDIFNNLKCNTTALPPAEFTCSPPPPPSSSSTKPVDPSSSSKPVDPSSSTKPVAPSSGSHPVSSSSMTNIAALLVVTVFIVALL